MLEIYCFNLFESVIMICCPVGVIIAYDECVMGSKAYVGYDFMIDLFLAMYCFFIAC